MMPKTKIEKTEDINQEVSAFLKGKDYKNYHYNDIVKLDYKVSTGSLIFDAATSGGLGPGVIRLIGQYSGGKTSESVQIAKCFLKEAPNPYMVYINAEGRLSDEILNRVGLEQNPRFGVVNTNALHVCFDLLKDLVVQNKTLSERRTYLFVIDSMDALSKVEDHEKSTRESKAVAGGALPSSHFLKVTGANIKHFGHMMIIISQRRSTINADQYKRPDFKNHSASGGHALDHFADWIFEFEGRYNKDKILKNESTGFDAKKNPAVGHICKIRVKKSLNEKDDYFLEYPIRYGASGDGSIWVSKEIMECMEKNDWYKQSGPWITIADEIISICKNNKIEIETKFQGKKALIEHIESNQKFFDYSYGFFRDMYSGS